MEESLWMVRAGRHAAHAATFLKHGFVAMAHREVGRLSERMAAADVIALYKRAFPGESNYSRGIWATQLHKFVTVAKPGDEILTVDRTSDTYVLGIIESAYEWSPNGIDELPHARRVRWTAVVPRSAISKKARNRLRASQTFFSIADEVRKELVANARALTP